mgnify:CR=1 FL=1
MIDDVFSFDDFLNKNGSKKLEPVTSIKDKFEEELNYKEEQEVVSEKKEFTEGSSFHRILWDDAQKGISQTKLKEDGKINSK